MYMTKKLLALLLAVTLAFGTFAITASAMQVYITVVGGSKTITLDVEPSDTIENVKAKIQDKAGYEPEKQTLVFNSTELDDSRTLEDYNVPPDSTMTLTVASASKYDAIYIYGNGNGSWLHNINWACDEVNKMTETQTNLYTYTAEDLQPAGTYQFKFTMGDLNTSWGGLNLDGTDFAVTPGTACVAYESSFPSSLTFQLTQRSNVEIQFDLRGSTPMVLLTVSEPTHAQEEFDHYYQITFTPASSFTYDSVNCYWWGGSNGIVWPGQAMTKVGDVWTLVFGDNDNIEDVIDSGVIFNNSSAGQTNNLAFVLNEQRQAGSFGTYVIQAVWGGSIHTHNDVLFAPWTSTTSLPTSGSYYLTQDVTVSMHTVLNGTLNLCLAGHTVTVTGACEVFAVPFGTILNLFDESGDNGALTIQNGSGSDHGLVYVQQGTFNLYGGTITGNTAFQGGGVYVDNNSAFNMYGGIISDNIALAGDGGGVFVKKESTFHMYGGTITGNTANDTIQRSGGGVFVAANASFIMDDGVISGNTSANGGGVCIYAGAALAEINGGTITNNTGYFGGGIIDCGSVLDLTGGTITGNTATSELQPTYVSVYTSGGDDLFSYGASTVNLSGTVIGGQMSLTHPITVTSDLGDRVYTVSLLNTSAVDGVYYLPATGVITSGLSGHGTLDNFANGSGTGFALVSNASGEAEFVPTSPVTVEFGAGHETFVQTYFSGIDGATVNGSKLIYHVPEGSTVADARYAYFDATWLIFPDKYDNGEYFMDNIGLQPASAYATSNAFNSENNAATVIPAEGITLYAQWAQPVGEVTVTITPPAVGTVIGTTGSSYSALYRSDPSVVATITGKASFSTGSGNIGNYITGIGENQYYTGTLVEDQACYTSMYVRADYGYFFGYYDAQTHEFRLADGVSVIVENDANALITSSGSGGESIEINSTVYAGDSVQPTPRYTITVQQTSGGSVSANKVVARVDDTITLTATPEDGYRFDRWIVTDANNAAVTVENNTFTMPASDVTVTAVFSQPIVTVEFGTGHAAFAQTYFGGIAGMTVSGTTGTLIVPEGTTVSEARGMLFGPISEDAIPMNAYYDSGEYFLSNFGLQPAGNYASWSALSDELNEAGSSPVPAAGITFYAQWAQPVGAVTITVTPPDAGTVIGTTGDGAMSRSDPSVEATITGHASFATDSGNIGNYIKALDNNQFYTGTLANGQACYASMYVAPKYGYFFGYNDANSGFQMAPGTSVTVTNDANAQILPIGSMMQVKATVYAVGKANDQMSVSVDDQIHLNLYLDLKFRGKTVNDVTITFGGETYACKGTKQTGGKYDGLYKFKVEMAPAQIADEIVVKIGNEGIPTSVKAYCSTLSTDAAYQAAEYADARALATAILHYGQAANNVFADGVNVLAANIANIGTMDKTAVNNYTGAVFTDSTNAVTGASFMALTKPEFRFYTSGITEAQGYAYNQAGITVEMANASQKQADALNARFVKKANGNVLLEVTGVLAENMDKEITVTIHGLEEGHNTITFNGNAFAKAMAKSSSNTQQSDLGAALYNYGAAAKTCFGA